MAVRANCTFNRFLYVPFAQRYFTCSTCSQGPLLVCEPCALLCHAGHTLSLENYGRPSLVVCECGKGRFRGVSGLNSGNPLGKHADCCFRQPVFQAQPPDAPEGSAFLDRMNIQLGLRREWTDLFMIYDSELGRDISLWEQLVYLCRGKCRNSFVAALLADLDASYDPEKT